MATVKISQLNSIALADSLVLPASNGSTTGKVTASQLRNSVDTLASGNIPAYSPSGTWYSTYTITTGSLANYKILKLSLRNVGFTVNNTRIQLTDLGVGSSPFICHNNGSGSTGVWVDCTINLIGGTLISFSENSGQQYDTNGSYTFMKAHSYTPNQVAGFIQINTSAVNNYFDGGAYTVLGIR
jgi:hypothetical protein